MEEKWGLYINIKKNIKRKLIEKYRTTTNKKSYILIKILKNDKSHP